MTEDSAIRSQIAVLELRLACLQARRELEKWGEIFNDRDKWHAVTEGQWPDRFTLLNRFVRTGLRPPFIFND